MSPALRKSLPLAVAALSFASTAVLAETPVIRSGINQEILSNALDPGDMKIILENIVKTAVFGEMEHETRLYQNGDALLQGLERGEIDVFAMTTLPYLENSDLAIEPTVVLQSNGRRSQRYVLLANKEKSVGKVLADFRGSELALLDNGVTDLVQMWIDVELGRAGLAKSEEFFSDITIAEKPNAAAFPVFFGKRDLCVISEDGWEVLALLNPKMKERLRVVATSEGIVSGLLLFREDTHPAVKKQCRQSLLRLHETPEGEQILRIGQVERIVEFEEGDLDTARAIYAEHQSLWGSAGATGLAAGAEPEKAE